MGIDVLLSESDKHVTINLDQAKDFTIEETFEFLQETLVETALSTLREEQSSGFDKKPKIAVDGKFGKSVAEVKPFGKIEFFSKLDSLKILLEVFDAIERRSPVLTGAYKTNNYVFANEKLVATTKEGFAAWIKKIDATNDTTIKTVRFLNATPYAARLEFRGARRTIKGAVKRKQKFSRSRRTGKEIKKPNGAYALAAPAVKRLLKGLAQNVKFEFQPNGFAGNIIGRTARYKPTRKNKRLNRVGKPYVFPTIKIELDNE